MGSYSDDNREQRGILVTGGSGMAVNLKGKYIRHFLYWILTTYK